MLILIKERFHNSYDAQHDWDSRLAGAPLANLFMQMMAESYLDM